MALFSLTVTAGDVAATLTNYPAYVDLTQMPSAFWAVVLNGGGDIRCYSDQAKTTELAREVVACDTGTDTGELHVKIPSLTTSTVIYIDVDGVRSDYAVTDPYGRNAVWSGYVSVHHLNEDPSASAPQNVDSTGNGYSTTSKGTMTSGNLVSGQLADGIQFDGTDDYLVEASFASLGTVSITFQCWAKPDSASTGGAFIKIGNSFGETGANTTGYALGVGSTTFDGNGNNIVSLFEAVRWMNTGVSLGTSWAMLHMSLSASSKPQIFKNGSSIFSDSGTNPVAPSSILHIGGYVTGAGTNRIPAASIDEVRVRSSILSANWITTEYNNQSDAAGFWTIVEVTGGNDYTLTASAGSFALNGVTVALKRGYDLNADAGASTLTGADLALRRAIRMSTTTGSFILTGVDANLEAGKRLVSDAGTFVLTGVDAALQIHRRLTVDSGSFTFTGNDVNLQRAYVMNAEVGVFVLTGIDVEFNFPDVYTLTAEPGVFTLTGYGVSLGLSLPQPMWVNEAIPGGIWTAGQAHLNAGDDFFDGFRVYAGQLGEVTSWDDEPELTVTETPDSEWLFEAFPGGTWFAGQSGLNAGDDFFDGFEVFAGQVGQTSAWENDAVE